MAISVFPAAPSASGSSVNARSSITLHIVLTISRE
jgi:hypothetical protein